jgi:thiol-disulfide isomerase/thioredoxin
MKTEPGDRPPAPGLGRRFALLLCLLVTAVAHAAPAGFSLVAADDTEISVEVMPADGDLLLIFLLDHDEERPQFEAMLAAIQAQGVEIWRVDLLADYFLVRSSENVRQLPGAGVASLIAEAHRRSDKRILLAAYDRMPLPLLRGVRQWQATPEPEPRLIGALLFYPNLHGPTPAAGREPQLDPITAATNLPLFIFQPERGAQRWRLQALLQALWGGGARAYVRLLPEVRDWFFMHPPGEHPEEDRASAAVAANLLQVARLLEAEPQPRGPAPMAATAHATPARSREMLAYASPEPAPALALRDLDGELRRLADFRGQVTLVNFWATWCPPCVEEIPSLNRLAERFAETEFSVLSVDYRESLEAIAKFTERVPVDFPILLDRDGRSSLDWKVFSFPSSFLIDRKGQIRYSFNRAIDWEGPEVLARIEALLAEPE